MKKKFEIKKLGLNKQSISHLSRLDNFRGGGPGTQSCDTKYTCNCGATDATNCCSLSRTTNSTITATQGVSCLPTCTGHC